VRRFNNPPRDAVKAVVVVHGPGSRGSHGFFAWGKIPSSSSCRKRRLPFSGVYLRRMRNQHLQESPKHGSSPLRMILTSCILPMTRFFCPVVRHGRGFPDGKLFGRGAEKQQLSSVNSRYASALPADALGAWFRSARSGIHIRHHPPFFTRRVFFDATSIGGVIGGAAWKPGKNPKITRPRPSAFLYLAETPSSAERVQCASRSVCSETAGAAFSG
jgi:hypothetical protein